MGTIGIETDIIRQKELAHTIKANGILEVPNQNKAFVTPLHGGVVKTLNVQPGTRVKEGERIATIVNPELLQMQQQLQQVNIQVTLAEKEFNRQKELVEGNAAPLKKLQQAEAELTNLRTQRDGLRNQLRGFGASESFSSTINVTAPISGTISKVIAQLGSNVDVASPIAEIVNNSQLHLDLFVYEKDLPKLKPNQVIHFTLTNNPGKEYDARIYSIGSAFENDSKTIPIHSRVIGDKTDLIDGMSITAIVSLDKSTLPAVPNDAIVTFQGQDYVFIMTEKPASASNEEHNDEVFFERIPVAKGNTDIGYTAITGLKDIPNDAKVVVKGAFFILAKMTNSGEEGH
ncbi:MAG: efflux RND transporter periplasmic adaptor subunit [Chitinophagaceae bacterium]|nr:efflux RND transporter periplasmic adaptor subunit [Chitinophagaceae bacterium]